MKRAWMCVLICVLLTACLSGCGCQAEKPVETAESSAPVLETEAVPAATAAPETTAETAGATETTKAVEATRAAKTTEPTENDFWELEVPEDTRPPIEVTVPKETQPYTDYEQYMNMSGEEQEKFFRSFENEQAFFDWFNAARDEYEAAHPDVIISGSTNIEIKP